jgi:phenylalanyl-tRNA synthetase alpha chain
MEIVIDVPEEKGLRAELAKRTDAEAARMLRFLNMPDLSRTKGSPIEEMVRRIVALPDFKTFDVVTAPEIVPARESFDLFNFPPDHPARSHSDTYYVNDKYILRTHTTIMWYYYLLREDIKKKIAAGAPIGILSYGKVYRKDEIDRKHMNVFHQIDGLYLCRRAEKEIGLKELQDVLAMIAKAIYGSDIKYRFNKDTFPYTDPSLEMEVDLNGQWLEVLGSGVVQSKVLDNLGIDSRVYNGWAFGFGLERLALLSMQLPDIRLLWSTDPRVTRQLLLGTTYKEVSKYPQVTRDISFIVGTGFVPNNYFDAIRDIGGDLVEEVSLLDKYENAEKFGAGKTSYAFRVVYRSTERTLTSVEVDTLHHALEKKTAEEFGGTVR